MEDKFEELKLYLTDNNAEIIKIINTPKNDDWYLGRTLPKPINKPQKQQKFRYYGCMAYFTRQSWDIVAQYIKNFLYL